jgi:outer membrane protein TolC
VFGSGRLSSSLLERRTHVAAAERQMQEQNALIGMTVAGYYPNITLGGTIGLSGGVPLPFNAANTVRKLYILDFGETAARPSYFFY